MCVAKVSLKEDDGHVSCLCHAYTIMSLDLSSSSDTRSPSLFSSPVSESSSKLLVFFSSLLSSNYFCPKNTPFLKKLSKKRRVSS